MLKKLKKYLFSFWVWQLLGWFSYWLMITFAFLAFAPARFGVLDVADVLDVVWFTFVRVLFGFTLSSLMSFIYNRGVNFSSPLKTFVLAVCSSFFFGCIWVYLMIIYSELAKPKITYVVGFERLSRDLLDFLTILLGWSAFYIGVKYWWALQTEREHGLKAQNLAQEAELKMLRYQLNPHFLFNSLNSASALIVESPTRAEKMIDELSDFLRYSLTDTKTDKVKLKDEIEVVRIYLNIEQIRFEEKLNVSFDISPDVKDFGLPNFLLHPLVENAVKYGMQTSKMPLQIEIKAEKENGAIVIEIINSGKWVERTNPKNNGTNVGIENVKKRLEHFFPERHLFNISENNNRVHILLKIN